MNLGLFSNEELLCVWGETSWITDTATDNIPGVGFAQADSPLEEMTLGNGFATANLQPLHCDKGSGFVQTKRGHVRRLGPERT